jgi:hypothetical protein
MARTFRRVGAIRYGVRSTVAVPEPAASPEPAEPEPEVSYRDLQAQAKEAGIPANQSRDELEAALEEAES